MNVSENVNVAIAFERIVMRIGYFLDIQLDGSVVCMQTGQN